MVLLVMLVSVVGFWLAMCYSCLLLFFTCILISWDEVIGLALVFWLLWLGWDSCRKLGIKSSPGF